MTTMNRPAVLHHDWTVTKYDDAQVLHEASGLVYLLSVVTGDGESEATLWAEQPSTRWDPPDVVEVESEVFTSEWSALRWCEARDIEAHAQLLYSEIDMAEAEVCDK